MLDISTHSLLVILTQLFHQQRTTDSFSKLPHGWVDLIHLFKVPVPRLQSDEAISAHANLAEDSTKVAWNKNTAA